MIGGIAACCRMALVIAVLHLCTFVIASVHSFFYTFFFFNLVSINRHNGPPYQRVLALCAFLTGVSPKGQILRKIYVRCLCMFCLCKFVYRIDFVVFESFLVR